MGSKDNNNKKDKSDAALSPASVNDATSPPAPEFTFDDAVLQSVGTPLKEVIEKASILKRVFGISVEKFQLTESLLKNPLKFDQEIRARNIDPDSPTFRIITDGQLPLRQCLHPEACAKDIELPNYYCKFSDLRKEYVRYKSAGLSRALVPVKDVKNLPNMPPLPAQPSTIAEMFSGACFFTLFLRIWILRDLFCSVFRVKKKYTCCATCERYIIYFSLNWLALFRLLWPHISQIVINLLNTYLHISIKKTYIENSMNGLMYFLWGHYVIWNLSVFSRREWWL